MQELHPFCNSIRRRKYFENQHVRFVIILELQELHCFLFWICNSFDRFSKNEFAFFKQNPSLVFCNSCNSSYIYIYILLREREIGVRERVTGKLQRSCRSFTQHLQTDLGFLSGGVYTFFLIGLLSPKR